MYYKIIKGKKVYSDCKTIQLEFDHPPLVAGQFVSNPSEELILADGWQVYVPPIHVRTLEEAKAERIGALEDYDSSDAVNSFTLGDKHLWVEPNDRTNYMMTLNAAAEMGIESISFMGYTVPVSYAIQILKLVSIYAMQCVGVTDAHREAINILDTIEAVDNYNFETGYPEKLVFNIEV